MPKWAAAHLAPADHVDLHTVQNQTARPFVGRFQQTDDAVSIAHGGNFRVGYDQYVICRGDRVTKAAFDTGRRIDQNKIDFGPQLVRQLNHICRADGGFVAGLGRRNEV